MSADADSSAVACSSTLWAQASKEWVIPAKPKPGRKPKKDASQPAKEDADQDAKGRRVQNRAAQRAFRERKQSQLQELQERVQAYEKSEIQRNVALQQASKRLLEENGQLKGEIASLKDEVARLQQRLAEATQPPASSTQSKRPPQPDTNKRLKRWRDESAITVSSGVEDSTVFLEDPSARKRPRAEVDNSRIALTPAPQYGQNVAYSTSPPSMASSPDSNSLSTAPFSPLSFPGTASHSSYGSTEPVSAAAVDAFKTFPAMESSPFEGFNCGLCSDGGVCMCTELALSSAASAMVSGVDGHIVSLGSFGGVPDQVLKVEEIESSLRTLQDATAPSAQPSAPYQIRLPSPEPTPAPTPFKRSMPLRSRTTKRSASMKVWQLTQSSTAAPPTCSGDPTNCPACKDDDFGKAFCQALGSASRTRGTACASCPNPEACGKAPRTASASACTAGSAGTTGVPTLQTIDLTGAEGEEDHAQRTSTTSTRSPTNTTTTETSSSASTAPRPSTGESTKPGTIPVNEAWARLKSHPNIAFADLSMLADVVARRVKCSGPVAVIHPAPGACTPERDSARSPAVPDDINSARKDSGPVLLTDPHALYHAQAGQRIQYPNTSAPANMASEVDASAAAAYDALPQDHPASQSLASSLSTPPSAIPVASHPAGLRLSDKPSLVPQEQLRECGRRRIREVDSAGVNDALRMLDAQFGKHV